MEIHAKRMVLIEPTITPRAFHFRIVELEAGALQRSRVAMSARVVGHDVNRIPRPWDGDFSNPPARVDEGHEPACI